jgi:hypothetical protein
LPNRWLSSFPILPFVSFLNFAHFILSYQGALPNGASTKNGRLLCRDPQAQRPLRGIEFQHVPPNNNVVADVLYKLGSKRALVSTGVFVQDLRKPSIKMLDPDNLDQAQPDLTPAPPRDVLMTEKEDDWREPFLAFLLD